MRYDGGGEQGGGGWARAALLVNACVCMYVVVMAVVVGHSTLCGGQLGLSLPHCSKVQQHVA